MNTINKDHRIWPIIVIWAAAYPGLIKLFAVSITRFNSYNSLIDALLAVVIMLLMTLLPLVCLKLLVNVNKNPPKNAYSLKILINLLVATPPLYILVGTVGGLMGVGAWQAPIWVASVLIGGLLVLRSNDDLTKPSKTVLNYVLIKKVHRYSAVLLVIGFFSLHLSNHLFALASNAKHEEIRLLFRGFYASDLVEPILFGLLLLMLFSGLPMAFRYMRARADAFRTLQIGSGIYMLFFLCAHVNATLGARLGGTETDWIFATGENGLINGYFFLIPYYFLSVLLIWLHVSLGIRMILISRRIDKEKANRIYYALLTLGGFFSIGTAAAILGVQFY